MTKINIPLSSYTIRQLESAITAICKQVVKKQRAAEHKAKHFIREAEEQKDRNLLYALIWMDMGSELWQNKIREGSLSKIAVGFSDSEIPSPDSAAGFSDSENGCADSATGFSDSENGCADSAAGFSDSENGYADSAAGFSDSENALPDFAHGFADFEKAMAEYAACFSAAQNPPANPVIRYIKFGRLSSVTGLRQHESLSVSGFQRKSRVRVRSPD